MNLRNANKRAKRRKARKIETGLFARRRHNAMAADSGITLQDILFLEKLFSHKNRVSGGLYFYDDILIVDEFLHIDACVIAALATFSNTSLSRPLTPNLNALSSDTSTKAQTP